MMCSLECSTFTLETILKDSSSHLFKDFACYLQQSYCQENLDFWLATQEYNECTNENLLALHCEKMINVYIRPNSPQEINIPCDMREAILEFYHQGNYHPDLFCAAAEAVLELMRVNSFVPWSMLNTTSSRQMKHTSSLIERWNLAKLKQARKNQLSFDYERPHFDLATHHPSVYKSMLKKIKKSLSGH
ncbi:RGS domain-containing protein [Sporodiniella umbellata]|nr:RGS domain-containing protein [Sporodiniella umbellata]